MLQNLKEKVCRAHKAAYLFFMPEIYLRGCRLAGITVRPVPTCAALDFTEEVTHIGEGGVQDATYAAVIKAFGMEGG